MKKNLLTVALTSVLAMTALAGCGGGSEQTIAGAGDKKIVLAVASPLSGNDASLGESIKLGAQMAVDQFKDDWKKKYGITLELAANDDKSDPKTGQSIAQDLVSRNEVLGVVGHLNSGVSIPASAVYNGANLVMVTPSSTNPKLTEQGFANVDRVCSRDDIQGPAGAQFAKNVLKANTIFIIQDKTAYGQGLADQFKKKAIELGMNVVGEQGINKGDVDFTAVLDQVKQKNPDLLYFGGLYAEGGVMLKQAREKGIQAKFMGGDGLDSGEFVKIAGDKVMTGVYFTSVAGDITKTDEGKKWADEYQQKFGKKVESYSSYGYNSALAILTAIQGLLDKNGGKIPSRSDVSSAVRATSGLKGLNTTISFNDKGDNKDAKIYIFTFKEAKYPAEQISEQ